MRLTIFRAIGKDFCTTALYLVIASVFAQILILIPLGGMPNEGIVGEDPSWPLSESSFSILK